jgi:hypothetical protein
VYSAPIVRESFESSRVLGVEKVYLKEGFFLPIQNIVQFIIPDFYGNCPHGRATHTLPHHFCRKRHDGGLLFPG